MRLSPRDSAIGRTIFRYLRGAWQPLHARFLNQIDERRGAAVHDRHFRRVELDDDVVDAQADERGQQVLDRLDRDVVARQARRELNAGEMLHRGRHLVVAEIGAAEADAEIGRRRLQREM